MDTSRKMLRNKNTCNFCIHYQPIKTNGKKQCKGICRISGTQKSRTDTCKNNFLNKGQIKLSIEEEKKEPVIEGKQLEINDFLEEEDKGTLRPYQLSFTKL